VPSAHSNVAHCTCFAVHALALSSLHAHIVAALHCVVPVVPADAHQGSSCRRGLGVPADMLLFLSAAQLAGGC
jgi:hypothetical protein